MEVEATTSEPEPAIAESSAVESVETVPAVAVETNYDEENSQPSQRCSNTKIDKSDVDDVHSNTIINDGEFVQGGAEHVRCQDIGLNVFCGSDTDVDTPTLLFIPDSNTFIHHLHLIDSILYRFSSPGN